MSAESRPERAAQLRYTRELTQLVSAALPPAAVRHGHRRSWIRRYTVAMVASDFLLSLLAALTAFAIRFGYPGDSADTVSTWR